MVRNIGEIFKLKSYEFSNTGEVKDKFMVVLRPATDVHYYCLHLFTTSQKKYIKLWENHEYLLIDEGTYDFFPLMTLINVNQILEISEDDMLKYKPDHQGTLNKKHVDELIKKVLNSRFNSRFHKKNILEFRDESC